MSLPPSRPDQKFSSPEAADPFPQNTFLIKSAEQKGLGLATLRKQLSAVTGKAAQHQNPPALGENTLPSQPILSAYDRQLKLETTTADVALERWQEEDKQLRDHGVLNVMSTQNMSALIWRWHQALEPAIRQEVQKSVGTEINERKIFSSHERLQSGAFLQNISTETLAALAIFACLKHVALRSRDDRGSRVSAVILAIAQAVQDEALAKYKKNNKRYRQWRALTQEGFLRKYGNKAASSEPSSSTIGQNYSQGGSLEPESFVWPNWVRAQVGSMMLSQLVDHAKIEVRRKDATTGQEVQEEQPAFFHSSTYLSGKRVGVIRMNPELREFMTRAPLPPTIAKQLPMLCPPKRWSGFTNGGYLEQPLGIVRQEPRAVMGKRYAMVASNNGDMNQVFAGLNALGKTPWVINQRVFEVMLEAWNTGEAIGKIPPENPKGEFPPEPAQTAPYKDRMAWLKEVKKIENYKAGIKSQRCFWNFQLEVAKAYLGETFFYPHNVDFRGRAYPMAPFLNHMGADNARGLLLFAEKKILGPSGLRWLKVHLANVYGFDKASLEERQRFTEQHVDDIRDAAENGIHGRRWWLSAEDPWQCLAACMDLKAALDLPDPTRHRSQLAVHQDGTCNGLQHYAAIGGDSIGAKQVNLEPGDRPSDIYTAVAEIIKAEISEEAANGHVLATLLDGKLTRKVVKQTVMTNVYGVTFVGARRQVRRQLAAILPNFPNTPEIHLGLAASYIAKKIFATLATMFNGAREIQRWFGDCAGRICRSLTPAQIRAIESDAPGEAVSSDFAATPTKKNKISPQTFMTGLVWTTPLKMPVVQSYSKSPVTTIATSFQYLSVYNPSETDPVDKLKQTGAFPPNFIHSLDGTHMFLTALKCDQVGLTFAAVHDSFWTHAGDVDTMNGITREAFIRMHSENIIERLKSEFEARYKDHMYLACIDAQSNLALKIKAWRKAQNLRHFNTALSASRTRELLLEVKRMRLLASQDPTLREEGASMTTAGSLYARAAECEISLTPLESSASLGRVNGHEATLDVDDTTGLEHTDTLDAFDPKDEYAFPEPHSDDATPLQRDSCSTDSDQNDGEGLTPQVASMMDSHNTRKLQAAESEAPTTISGKDQRPRTTPQKLYLWLPLTFPPVPKRVSDIRSF